MQLHQRVPARVHRAYVREPVAGRFIDCHRSRHQPDKLVQPMASNTQSGACHVSPPCTAGVKLQRVRVPLQHHPPASGQATSLTVLQWNILADGLAQHGDFIKVPPQLLEWAYRRPLIVQEVLEARADVLCFQELNHFDELQAALAEHGYEGVFMQKKRSPACKYDSPPDGVALFWRAARLQPIRPPAGFHFQDELGADAPQCCLHVLLREVPQQQQQQPPQPPQQAQQAQQATAQVQPSHQGPAQPAQEVHGGTAAQAEAAQPSLGSGSGPGPGPARQVLVATTHLKAKEGAGLDQVRTAQMRQLLHSLQRVLEQAGSSAPGVACAVTDSSLEGASGRSNSSDNGGSSSTMAAAAGAQAGLQCTPVVVAGDFNSVPASGPCQLLSAHPWSFQSIWDVPVAMARVASNDSPGQGATQPPLQQELLASPGDSGSNGNGVPPRLPGTQGSGPAPSADVPPGQLAGPAQGEAASVAPQQQRVPEGTPGGGNGSQGTPAAGAGPPATDGAPAGSVHPRGPGGDGGASDAAGSSMSSGEFNGAEFSTWKFRSGGESKRVIDHLYYSAGSGLQPVSRWRMLSEAEIGGTGLPCARYPSDHIALCCQFVWE